MTKDELQAAIDKLDLVQYTEFMDTFWDMALADLDAYNKSAESRHEMTVAALLKSKEA